MECFLKKNNTFTNLILKMKFNKYLLILLFVPFLAFTSMHKYYLSLTQIEYNEKSRSLQITMNVFIDDFELTMNNTFDKQFNLNTEDELVDSETYFHNYLKEHFKVKLGGQSVNFNYIGRKYEGDVVFFYLEFEDVANVKSIEIENTVLFEYFDDQKNLIKLKIKGEFDSLLLTKGKKKGLLNF